MSTRAQIGMTLACVAVFLCFWGVVIRNHNRTTGPGSDVTVYERYAEQVVLLGQAPYRNFSVEYPPGFLVPALAPTATSNPGESGAYVRDFGRWMAGAGVAMIVLAALALGALRARPAHFAAALGFMAITPVLLGGLMFARFDLWATTLAIGGLAALLSGRDRTGGALIGAAIATKIWPAVLVPLGLVWVWRRYGRTAALRWLAIVVAVCAAFFIPFAVLAPGGLGHSFGLQLDRPLQIESLGSALLLFAHHAGGLAVSTSNSYGSQNLVAHGAKAVSIGSALLQVLALSWPRLRRAGGPAACGVRWGGGWSRGPRAAAEERVEEV